MMPLCGLIFIFCNPNAGDSFRLGLMAVFGLSIAGAKGPVQDEHIEFTRHKARNFCLHAEDNDEGALEEYERMRIFMAPKEPRFQRYFDHGLFFG